MKPILKKMVLASALVGAMMVGGTAYADSAATVSQPADSTQAKSQAQYLFVLSAKSGDIAQSGQGYTLTLNNVDPQILWFTDRPNRKAGFVPLSTFLASWSKGFAGSPPNAALVHVGMVAKVAGKNQPMAMELSKPTYTSGQLTFKVTDLKGDKVNVGTVQRAKVFFDDGWITPRHKLRWGY